MTNHDPGTDHTAEVYGMAASDRRLAAVDEVHARPYLLIEPPHALVQLVFMNGGSRAGDRAAMAGLSGRLGLPVPEDDGPYHGLSWRQGALHCEKHIEFSTYLWSAVLDPASGRMAGDDPLRNGFTPPGPVLCGIRLEVLPWSDEAAQQISRFDAACRCHSIVEGGLAEIVTDFRQDADGLTRMLILDRGLAAAPLGALAQRLLDIDTYRVMALLGRPLSLDLLPRIRDMEQRLTAITADMRHSARSHGETLLSQLTDLSATLEADGAAILYRFGASRSYYEIVEERLSELDEQAVPGCYRWRDFLQRRLAPAMRTCRSVQERLNELSAKLAGAIALLSSWIDVQLEHQNGALLASMNDRARRQLHLQQTVEGLSVAAISYYVVALLAHVVEGVPGLHDLMAPSLVVAIAVPFVMLTVWWMVRRIRLSHSDDVKTQ